MYMVGSVTMIEAYDIFYKKKGCSAQLDADSLLAEYDSLSQI